MNLEFVLSPDTLIPDTDTLPVGRRIETARAVIFEGGHGLCVRELELNAPGPDDVIVDVMWSGVSTGTEKLLWSGKMPPFPGLSYPLVPGYEAVGRVAFANGHADLEGRIVFIPGSNGFADVAGLFGASASRLVVAARKLSVLDMERPEEGVLLALAATAHHAIAERLPELIVGHGVLGRLTRRICAALGASPTVWEIDPARQTDGSFSAIHPDADDRRDYGCILDMSGAGELLDTLIMRLAKGGEIVLGGFYHERLGFDFPMAFIKEARLRVAAEWTPGDLDAVLALITDKRLSLSGLITHTEPADRAAVAYQTAFTNPACLKMTIDWRPNHG